VAKIGKDGDAVKGAEGNSLLRIVRKDKATSAGETEVAFWDRFKEYQLILI
jgi:hypothetical protein